MLLSRTCLPTKSAVLLSSFLIQASTNSLLSDSIDVAPHPRFRASRAASFIARASASREDYGEVKFLSAGGSPFARRVQIVLKLKGVEYKYFEEDLQNKSELLLKYNPVHKKVPVLVHNEQPITESLVILEYIDEVWKNYPILPSHPYHRAQARFWSRFIDDKLLPPIFKAAWTVEEKEKEKAMQEASEGLQILEKELNGKFFGGDTIGIVDIAAGFIAFWLPLIQEASDFELFTQDKLPKLYEWSQEFCSHPVVKDNLPPAERLLGFFKARYAAITASK